MSAQGRNYLANHVVAPQIIQGTPNYNVEVAEGQVPPGEFYPAYYLPGVQPENRIGGSVYTLMPGKVVCLDQNTQIVPAGLVAQVNGKNSRSIDGYSYDVVNAAASAATKYDKYSTEYGVLNFAGNFATEGDDFVFDNEFDAGKANAGFKFTNPVGIMRYSALKNPSFKGGSPSNPATFVQHAYDTGGARAFSRWCYIQVPVVETAEKTETIKTGATTYRFALYADETIQKIKVCNTDGSAVMVRKSLPAQLDPPSVAGTADQYAIVGRTIIFNDKLALDKQVVYLPKIMTPFASLVTGTVTSEAALVGSLIGYNIDSNYTLFDTADATKNHAPFVIGQILDVKDGTDNDLKLVRSYFRDFGLWQEQPGSATDGRNTQLSIANAPKYIARIAVSFDAATFNLQNQVTALAAAVAGP